MERTLYVVDAYSLIYRSFYAIKALRTSKGIPTNAVYGFIRIMLNLVKSRSPERLAVVFDSGKKTERHALYPEYKATRQKMPEDLSVQIEMIKKTLPLMGFKTFEKDGVEADDIIASFAGLAERGGYSCLILTGDKDLMQVVSPRVAVLRSIKGISNLEVVDEKAVLEKFGVSPGRLRDYLSLVGDTSDNIPGVRGVGEKQAASLINTYGSLDALYENLSGVKNESLRKKLEEGRENAFLSRRLVTLDGSLMDDMDLETLTISGADKDRLRGLLTELEFFNILEEFGIEKEPPEVQEEFIIASDRNTLGLLKEALLSSEMFSFSFETELSAAGELVLCGASFYAAGSAYYIPCGHALLDSGVQISPELLVETAGGAFSGSKIKLCFDIKKQYPAFEKLGIEPSGPLFDMMILGYIADPDSAPVRLSRLAKRYLEGPPPDEEALESPVGSVMPVPEAASVSCRKSVLMHRLYEEMSRTLPGREDVFRLYEELDYPLALVLRDMERTGVRLDRDFLKTFSDETASIIRSLERKIYKEAGGVFNLNSPKQLASVLFEKMQLPPGRKTKTGYSTDFDVLTALSADFAIARLLIEYRELSKLKNTYIDVLLEISGRGDGRVRSTFNQCVAATGRLSSTDPNLQNIPIRTENGKKIRMAFTADGAGSVLVSADYSQIELRIMAHFSGAVNLIRAFEEGDDVHSLTAVRIFGIKKEDVTEDMRRTAKTINFGIIYGMSPFGLSSSLGISREEAGNFIDAYFGFFPEVREYMQRTIAYARENGCVITMLGRKRYINDINSRNRMLRDNAERVAINTPIQGTAADLIKKAMIDIHGYMKKERVSSRMLLQVHDELVFEVPERELSLIEDIRGKMENALELKVPVRVDIKKGRDLYNMEKLI